MPFKSQAQRGFMYSQHPKLAKEFEKATPKGKKLSEHVQKMADGGKVDKPFNSREEIEKDKQGLAKAEPDPILSVATFLRAPLAHAIKEVGAHYTAHKVGHEMSKPKESVFDLWDFTMDLIEFGPDQQFISRSIKCSLKMKYR